MKHHQSKRGIALLITLLTVSVLLGVTASLLNTSVRQYQLSNIAKDSEVAFQAASAGMECIYWHDHDGYPVSKFGVNGDGSSRAKIPTLDCMGETDSDGDSGPDSGDGVESGEEQRFQFSWGASGHEVCSEISIYKFYDDGTDGDTVGDDMSSVTNLPSPDECVEGLECTVMRARGYNAPCASLGSGNRVIEREIVQHY